MYSINNYEVKNYLEESSELKEIIRDNQLIYIIAGCGMGKTTFTKNYLMKNYVVLNVNFLNAVNQQSFGDVIDKRTNEVLEKGTYQIGDTEINDWDGLTNMTINIQNLSKISDECINVMASNNGILVIDEIQKMYQDSYYRKCCGDSGLGQIKRFKDSGVKVIIMTGTPLTGIEFEGFVSVRIKKTEIRREDSYVFTWMKGLNKVNIHEFVSRLISKDYFPIILCNEKREQVYKRLISKGINVGYVESSDRIKEDTETNYILREERTSDKYDCLLCTSVIQEGLNIKEDIVDKKLVFISFINEIYAAPQLIQFAGRARNQLKRVFLGYNKLEEFNLNFKETIFEFESDEYDLAKERLIKETSKLFNSKEDWENYIKEYTHKCTFMDSTIDEIDLNFKYETDIELIKTDWMNYCKELFKDEYKNSVIVNKTIQPSEESGLKVEKIKNNRYWFYTANRNKANMIKYLVDKELVVKSDIEKLDEEILLRLAFTVKLSRLYKKALDKTEGAAREIVLDQMEKGLTIDYDNLYKSLMNFFKMEYRVNGEIINVDNALNKDQRNKIKGPVEELLRHRKTMALVIRNLKMQEKEKESAYNISIKFAEDDNFGKMLENLNIVNTFLEEEKDRKRNESRKGAYKGLNVKKTYTLIENNSIIFNNLSDCYNYVKDNGYKNSFDSFQKRDWKKYYSK